MKIIFICSNDVNMISGGGSQCTNRNYLSLKEIVGPDNIEVIQLTSRLNYTFPSAISRIGNYLRGFNAGLNKREIQRIIDLSKDVDYVFIDSSEHGAICYYLKKSKFEGKIITFFHNVEHTLYLQRVKSNPLIFWKSFIIYYNEKLALKYSNRIIILTYRDLEALKRTYKGLIIPETFIIPISFKDNYFNEKTVSENIKPPLTCLFVGDAWFANLHGIQWFINNVLDKVNVRLQIAGKASDAIKLKGEHEKIDYLGFVPDLTNLIINADIFLAPIFKGGGMKVKICEALMFGKIIIGTKEALNGYDLDLEKVGAICNTEAEFVDAINKFSLSNEERFNKYNRNCFLEKYSFQATLKKFNEVLLENNKEDLNLINKEFPLQEM